MPSAFYKNRRWIIAATVLVVVVGVGVAIKSTATAKPPTDTGPATLEFGRPDLAYVTNQTIARTLAINGTVEARSQAVVKAKQALDIKRITVREGDPVRTGQVLAQLDPADLEARLMQKTSTRDSARAQFELADKQRATNHTLLEKSYISQNAYDSVDSTYKADKAALQAAEADVELARIALSQATVTAPISGIVGKRYLKVGEKTSIDQPLFTIVDLDSLEFQALIPATEVSQLKPGQHAQLQVDGIGDRTFDAVLDRISPATEPGTRSILVFFTVANPQHLLRSGIFANGQIALGTSTPVPALPQTAVQSESGQSFVWTIEHDRLTRHPVTLGARDDTHGWVEVHAALPPGVPVLASRFENLKEGNPAVVKNSGETPRSARS